MLAHAHASQPAFITNPILQCWTDMSPIRVQLDCPLSIMFYLKLHLQVQQENGIYMPSALSQSHAKTIFYH